jgi:dephospho-CoA kinase
VLLVDADAETRLRRVQARDGRREEEIRAIQQAQAGRADQLSTADDIITNNGAIGDLTAQVAILHASYLAMAARPSNPGGR